MEKISYKKLEELGACKAGLRWFKDVFGFDGEATFEELLRCDNYEWVSWLIIKVPVYQTEEILKKYLEMNKTDFGNFSWLIENVPNFQTEEILKKYLRKNKTHYGDLGWLIKSVPNFQTEEILKKYLRINKTDYDNFRCLIENVPNFQTEANYEILNKMQEVQKWKR